MYAFADGDTSCTPTGTAGRNRLDGLGRRHRTVGEGIGFPGDRHRGHRSRRRGAAVARLARRGTARRDGLYGTARRRPGAPRRARSGHAASHHRADELPPAGGARKRGDPGRSDQGIHRALRARPRLPQGAARQAAAPRDARSWFDRRLRLPRLHRQRAGARSGAGREVRDRLAGQAHAAPDTRSRLLVLSGRDLHRSAAAGLRAAIVALRKLQRVHRRLPDGRDRRALRARCPPLHLVPHDRASRQHSRGVASPHRQSRLWVRRLPALLPVEPVRAGHRRSGFRGSQRARRRRSRHAVRVDRSAIRCSPRRQRDPANRL